MPLRHNGHGHGSQPVSLVLDRPKSNDYYFSMNVVDKTSENRISDRDRAAWLTGYLRFLHPGIILAISFATAAAVFITDTELFAIAASEFAVLKLLAGTALLFFVGLHFTQRLIARQNWRETEMMFDQNASDFARMEIALNEVVPLCWTVWQRS